MLKFSELKVGDLVMAEYEGNVTEGEIIDVDSLDRKVCVLNADDQEFWFEPSAIRPISLDEGQLFKLGFQKQVNDDGSIKYMKGAFRVLIHHEGDFSNFEMWYREDQRHIKEPIFVHDFQNKYFGMTKVVLSKD